MSKYSQHKVTWFPNKLESFLEGELSPPIYVRIKPTNICNHKCTWCIYHESDMSQMHTDMGKQDEIPRDKMMEILYDFRLMGVPAITFSGGGEPLLYPHIVDTMKKVKEYEIDLSIITNGQLLTGEKAELLHDAKWVRISIDYADKKGFKQSRRVSGRGFNKIMTNIEEFAANKKTGCDLCVNFIVTKENHKDLIKAGEMLISLGVEYLRFSPMWTPKLAEYHNNIATSVVTSINVLQEVHEDKIDSSYTFKKFVVDPGKRNYTTCYWCEVNPVIGADLNVYPCHNQAYSNDSVMFSMKDQTFFEGWYGEDMFNFLEKFNCQETCTSECTADVKNEFIKELIDCYGDNFV